MVVKRSNVATTNHRDELKSDSLRLLSGLKVFERFCLHDKNQSGIWGINRRRDLFFSSIEVKPIKDEAVALFRRLHPDFGSNHSRKYQNVWYFCAINCFVNLCTLIDCLF